nr:T9SS type A sorting domain-containing protein [Bacteroidota bacterium]
MQSTQGCDSVVQTALTINPTQTHTDTVNIVKGDSTFAGGMWQTQSGIYYDSLTTQFGCDSLVITVLNVFTSINAITTTNNILTVHPNPAQNILEVTVNLARFVGTQTLATQTFGTQTLAPQTFGTQTLEKITFQLIDIHGKVKLTATLTLNQKHLLDISSLASGIYVAQIIYEGRKYEKKVLKE